jgi:hypothetical protein
MIVGMVDRKSRRLERRIRLLSNPRPPRRHGTQAGPGFDCPRVRKLMGVAGR